MSEHLSYKSVEHDIMLYQDEESKDEESKDSMKDKTFESELDITAAIGSQI